MASSTAISAQGSKLYISGTPGSAINITAITKAADAVVSAASHGTAVGDIVQFGTVAGMPEIYNKLGYVVSTTSGTFTVDIDSSGYATAGTTGTANEQTWTQIKNFIDYNGFDGSASELDKTHMDSDAMENSPGLQDFGTFGFNIDVDNADAGQLAMRAAKTASTIKNWKLVLPNDDLRFWSGWVKKFTEQGGVNKILKAAVDVRITGEVSFYDVA